MKKLLLVTTPLIFAACQPMPPMAMTPPAMQPVVRPAAHANLPAETARQGQYIALPGQAAVDTDAAFDQQVAAYANPGAAPAPAAPQPAADGSVAPAAPVPAPAPSGAGVIVNPTYPTYPPASASPVPAAPTHITQPTPDMGGQYVDPHAAVAGSAGMMPQPADSTPVGGLVDYTLRITNATPGRVFVEAQDAAGEIYPCGFMTGSQSISSEKKQVAPIKGPITVVVRDPDKPEAPELRRYKVTPPAGYAGKTLEITIISGGLYQVSVDGQVRYITPTPVGKPDLGNAASTPAAAVNPTPAAPAPKPAEPAGPAPEQTPAGM